MSDETKDFLYKVWGRRRRRRRRRTARLRRIDLVILLAAMSLGCVGVRHASAAIDRGRSRRGALAEVVPLLIAGAVVLVGYRIGTPARSAGTLSREPGFNAAVMTLVSAFLCL